ncbi:mucin-2 [Armigeres subalbatus]|uniref:mucin-2 n=1 Tax=Armigeres subalbatus TaxID=124917 RepID=UPI002ED4884B
MHMWHSVILQTCILITCHIPLNQCSMRIVTPARVLAARTGATQFQEYADDGRNVGRGEQQSRRFQKRLIADTGDNDFDNYQGVVGRPGIDFPVLTGIPNTNFNCRQYGNGYFADLDTKCQVFHICDEGKKISFLCPNGTIFRQLDLICDWWFKVDCAAAPNHYAESSEMLTQAQRARIQSKHPIPQPIKSPEQFSLNVQRKHAILNGPLGPNFDALAFNRRMDTSVEESDESIDFEDISLKRNNVRRSNLVSRGEKSSSEETQTADETASFARSGKAINGYNYPAPDKTFEGSNTKPEGYNYEKPIKLLNTNDKASATSSRTAKILENNFSQQQFGQKNSFTFDAKPFITRATEAPTVVTSTTTKQQTLRATTASTVSRGSTTHQTSTLNQKPDRKSPSALDIKNSKPAPSPTPENLNFPAYTTARKPSTKAKDKPFYTPTIPTVTNKASSAEQTTAAIPTSATVSGAAEHAMEMMKTLQELEISEPVVENRPGVEVPPSSGPNALHSLALYFADDSAINATTTNSPVEIRSQTEKLQTEENRPSSVSATLLSQRTLERYQQLFNVKTPSTTTESLEFETRFSDDSSNDLEGQYSRHPIFGTSASPQIRELAQVFTHALSAYLQDPDTFRRILSEIRPKAPPQLIVSNQIDQTKHGKNDDISTEEASYFFSRNQITPAPRAALTEDLEVLDFSDVTLPTTVKRETTIGASETTTELPVTTTVIPSVGLPRATDGAKKTPASNLITNELEKTASAYRERQSKTLKSSKDDTKNDLADEVNEELGTLKPPAYKAVESIEDLDEKIDNSTYYPPHGGYDRKSTLPPYDAQSLKWGEELSTITTTTDSSPTVYYELQPPLHGKSNPLDGNLPSKVFLPPDRDDILEDDEQLQRAQSQSIVSSRNSIGGNKKPKTIYSFLNLDKALEENGKLSATNVDVPNTTIGSTTIKGHYITKQFNSEKIEATTISSDIATPIPDTGKITPNSKTTLSYTVFLDPLTINDGLMDSEEAEDEDKTTILNAHTYLPRSQKKTTNAYVASTTPPISTTSTKVEISGRLGKSKKLSEEESNENELMETMQRKANLMFGDLNETEADHLMNVMKTADTNKSVRRLILLLIQTCDDDYNKTVEDSRKALLNALISMDSQENDSSEIRIVKSRSSRRMKSSKKPVIITTVATPVTTFRNSQFERLIGTTTELDVDSRASFETTTSGYEETKSTILDSSTETATRFFENRFGDDSETTTPAISLFPEHYTTTSIPTTTLDFETTTNPVTTTETPTTTIVSTIPTTRLTTAEPTTPKRSAALRESPTSSSRTQKSLSVAGNYIAEASRNSFNQHSDTRALELLRSLYSLASRWG